MVDVTGKIKPFVFFTQTQGMGTVIPKINQFATDINEQVFGRSLTAKIAPAQPAQTVAPVPTPQNQPPVTDQRAHPDKLMEQGFSPDDRKSDLDGTALGSGADRHNHHNKQPILDEPTI